LISIAKKNNTKRFNNFRFILSILSVFN
jgi:hypothetical protein